MSRKPSVWFREQDGWFYTTSKGKQIKLSQNEKDAEREFHALLAKRTDEPATVYSYRHTYITEALERGLTASMVAELVGNSAKTIEKYYNHLSQKRDSLKAAALRAVGGDLLALYGGVGQPIVE